MHRFTRDDIGKSAEATATSEAFYQSVDPMMHQTLICSEDDTIASLTLAIHENSGTIAAAASWIVHHTASMSLVSVDIVPIETRTIQCPAAVAGVT
ncbi:hypothetical protein ACVIU7_004498 [Bradyrhizobium liaoningense]